LSKRRVFFLERAGENRIASADAGKTAASRVRTGILDSFRASGKRRGCRQQQDPAGGGCMNLISPSGSMRNRLWQNICDATFIVTAVIVLVYFVVYSP